LVVRLAPAATATSLPGDRLTMAGHGKGPLSERHG
jgi:hypothetical protein